jgi:hypothetical protein
VTVDIAWTNGGLQQASLVALRDKTVRVRSGAKVAEHRLRAGEATIIRGGAL